VCLSSYNNKQINSVCSSQAGDWVIKVKTNKDTDELTQVLTLLENPPRNMVEVPTSVFHRFGVTEDKVWYAMKLYDGHLTKANADKWRLIGKTCIQFLADLHANHRKVYMDFRLENILVSGNTFVVADYELLSNVEDTVTKKAGRNTAWYFYSKGAEPDQWLYSWRQDLVGLGYLLVELTTNLSFYADFMNRRIGRRANHKSTKELLRARDEAVLTAHPTLRVYMEKIKEVRWDSLIPPLPSFYRELEELFIEEQQPVELLHQCLQ
jgi:hypothetical protein